MWTSKLTERLPWHQQSWEALCALEQRGQLPHAYLFQGPEGLGKLNFSLRLSQYLLCRASQDKPCGDCTTCRLFLAGTHPDLKLLQPEDSKSIRIEQIRDTIDFVGKRSQQGGHKVVIVEPAEAMNKNAANALLKVLEEPAADTLLILISHQAAQLLPTLRSRCRSLKFTPPETSLATVWLDSKNLDISSSRLLKLADGAPLRALDLAATPVLRNKSILYENLAQLLDGAINIPEAAQACLDFDLMENLNNMMQCSADMLRLAQSADEGTLHDPELLDLSRKLSGKAMVRDLHDLYRELLAARRRLLSKANPNPLMMLESLFFSWSELASQGKTPAYQHGCPVR
ncbi:MAG: DNA polymerase III subunit delta' [Pseudomonadales bacterium]|nr:DNA polymerase III subunit delta' [Pseudomonadales bacterium]